MAVPGLAPDGTDVRAGRQQQPAPSSQYRTAIDQPTHMVWYRHAPSHI